MVDFYELSCKIDSLVIFRKLRKDKIISKICKLYYCDDNFFKKYSVIARKIYENGGNLTEYILNKVLEDENFCIVNYAQTGEMSESLEKLLDYELKILDEVSKIASSDIIEYFRDNFYIRYCVAEWDILENISIVDEYKQRLEKVGQYGYGIFSKYHVFRVKEGNLVPVKNPDTISLKDMIGYELQRKAVIDNTIALIDNKPAGNVLLYGDAGTGKSSTVKAIVNEYKSGGLRVVEISKKQLREIPQIIDNLSKNPLKFIIFIDDLSFAKDDEDFGELKAILEGSVSARTSNIVIYATSNRRHLVKESFSDRDGDDIHHNDTVQELISLSERFGVTVNFSKPNKDSFIEIVKGLAKQYKLDISDEVLIAEAEKFVLRKSGRSPRAAKHFIEYMKTKETL